jgi:hypothetical protein
MPAIRRTGTVLTAAAACATLLATSATAAGPSWHNVAVPKPVSAGAMSFLDAAGTGKTAWAVGTENSKTTLLGWNGTTWKRQSSPTRFIPTGVAVANAKNAWAGGIGVLVPVAMHWNGTKWSQVPYPGYTFPMAFAAAPDGSAWSISGVDRSGGGPSSLLRWTGKAWASVTVPLPPSSSMSAIGARSKTDVWVGGTYSNGIGVYPLVLHWNGSSWKRMAAPSGSWGQPAHQNIMQKIVPVSATSVWALRSQYAGSLLHWNGKSWREIPLPLGAQPLALADDGKGGAWVTTGNAPSRTTYLHWTGTKWTTVYGPVRKGATTLSDLDHVPGGSVLLSVGATKGSKDQVPFIERYGS